MQNTNAYKTDSVKVLHPSRHKIGHIEDDLPRQSLGLVLKNPNKHNESKHASATKYTNTLEGHSVERIPTLTFDLPKFNHLIPWPRIWLAKFGDNRTWIKTRKLFTNINTLYIYLHTHRALDLLSTGHGFKAAHQPWASCSHLCASVTEQYNLVPAKGRWCSVAGKVTAGLAESNGSLLPGRWLSHLWADSLYTRDQLRAQRSVTSMRSLYLFNVQKEKLLAFLEPISFCCPRTSVKQIKS